MPNKLIDFKVIGAFAAGYCFAKSIEKDYALKPLLCTLACAAGTLYGPKISYDQYIKPMVKTIRKKK